jgi:hypothetical protein
MLGFAGAVSLRTVVATELCGSALCDPLVIGGVAIVFGAVAPAAARHAGTTCDASESGNRAERTTTPDVAFILAPSLLRSALSNILWDVVFRLVTQRRSSCRSFFQVAQPMCRLNIVRMVVSPRPSLPFGVNAIRHDVVVVGEFNVADGAFSVLLDDLAIQHFPHLRRFTPGCDSSGLSSAFAPSHRQYSPERNPLRASGDRDPPKL